MKIVVTEIPNEARECIFCSVDSHYGPVCRLSEIVIGGYRPVCNAKECPYLESAQNIICEK